MTKRILAPSKTEGGPTLVTIEVVIKPDTDNGGSPKIMAPVRNSQTSVTNGNILCWEVQNFCSDQLWIEFQGFQFQPDVFGKVQTVNIPNLFNNFASYGDPLPAATSNGPSVTTCLGDAVSAEAPMDSD